MNRKNELLSMLYELSFEYHNELKEAFVKGAPFEEIVRLKNLCESVNEIIEDNRPSCNLTSKPHKRV